MKVSKEKLVKLVLHLTAREQQEFKELYTGNFDYVELFKYIIKHKSLDEKAFAVYLSKQKGNDNVKSINISVIKSYLLEKILNSLRSSYKSPVALTYLNLMYSDILISKGLYDIAESYLEETSAICQTNHLIQEELIYFRQLNHIIILNGINTSGDVMEERFARHHALLDIMAIEETMLHFITVMTSFVFYNLPPNPDTFFDLFSKINVLNEKEDYPFFIKQQILLTKASFEIFQSDDPTRIDKIKKLYASGINEWKDNKRFMEYNGYWFLNSAMGYFFITVIIGANKEENDSFANLLLLFETQTKSNVEKNRSIELRYACEILYLLNSSDNNKYQAVLLFKEKFKALAVNGFIGSKQIRVWEQYSYITAHLHLGEYNEVIDICNELLYDKELGVKNFMIFYAPVHFALLQSHYELGHLKFLKYEITKSKAAIEKNGTFGEFEEQFFKLMKLLVSEPTDKEKSVATLTLHKTSFEALLEEGFFKVHFGVYDIMNWLEVLMGRCEA